MISEYYKNLSDYADKDIELIKKGYRQYFKNENYFELRTNMPIIEYNYDNYRIFLCDNADVIITYKDKIQSTIFTCEIADIKVDNKNNVLTFVSGDFSFLLIDFKTKKIFNSYDFI